MIKVLFFGKLRDQFDLNEIKIEESCSNILELFTILSAQYPILSSLKDTDNLLIAVNQDMKDAQATIKHGDEVAFFPPVTGG